MFKKLQPNVKTPQHGDCRKRLVTQLGLEIIALRTDSSRILNQRLIGISVMSHWRQVIWWQSLSETLWGTYSECRFLPLTVCRLQTPVAPPGCQRNKLQVAISCVRVCGLCVYVCGRLYLWIRSTIMWAHWQWLYCRNHHPHSIKSTKYFCNNDMQVQKHAKICGSWHVRSTNCALVFGPCKSFLHLKLNLTEYLIKKKNISTLS